MHALMTHDPLPVEGAFEIAPDVAVHTWQGGDESQRPRSGSFKV